MFLRRVRAFSRAVCGDTPFYGERGFGAVSGALKARRAFPPRNGGASRVLRGMPDEALFRLHSARQIRRRQPASIGVMQNMMKWENLPNRRVKILSEKVDL